jgi:hypothetical protein
MATQSAICRYVTFVRAFVVQAVVDNPVAMAAMREVWGMPAKPGTVTISDDPAGSAGSVATPDGVPLAEWRIDNLEGAEAARVLLESEITVRLEPRFAVAGDATPPRLIQVNRAYALRDPKRGRVRLSFGDAAGYPWALLPVTHPIIGVDTMADLHYEPTEYVLDYQRQPEVNGTVVP